jgi:hypothetical protein
MNRTASQNGVVPAMEWSARTFLNIEFSWRSEGDLCVHSLARSLYTVVVPAVRPTHDHVTDFVGWVRTLLGGLS